MPKSLPRRPIGASPVNGGLHHVRLRRRACNPSRGAANEPGHRGMLPCFFGGEVSTFVSSIRRPETRRARVSAGSMTAST